MEEILNELDALSAAVPADFSAFPDIELYMDQVTAFLARQKASMRDGDRLTSAMVNNYIKDGLLPRAKGKKYNRDHLAYLTVIMRLKQVLSVKDTAALLRASGQGRPMEACYPEYAEKLEAAFAQLRGELAGTPDADAADMAMTLALNSYVCKIACEYLLDQLSPGPDGKKRPQPRGQTD